MERVIEPTDELESAADLLADTQDWPSTWDLKGSEIAAVDHALCAYSAYHERHPAIQRVRDLDLSDEAKFPNEQVREALRTIQAACFALATG